MTSTAVEPLDAYLEQVRDRYRHAPRREPCACGGIVAPLGVSDEEIRVGVIRHNATHAHQDWCHRREAAEAAAEPHVRAFAAGVAE